jgi:hypothetical protein
MWGALERNSLSGKKLPRMRVISCAKPRYNGEALPSCLDKDETIGGG